MKVRALGILAVLLFFTVFSTITAHALLQNEIILNLTWSASTYYQGDSGNVTISLQSACSNELKFTSVGIHFQWMLKDYYYKIDLASNPISIPSKGSCTFQAISFNIPSDASIGDNQYDMRIEFKEHHWYGWWDGTWASGTLLINIHDAYEKVYYNTKTAVDNKITQAISANFQSADAKSLLQQAINEKNLATQLAGQGKWSDAVTHLQTASNLADQATSAEKSYQVQQQQQQQQLIFGAIGAGVVVIALVALKGRSKRKP